MYLVNLQLFVVCRLSSIIGSLHFGIFTESTYIPRDYTRRGTHCHLVLLIGMTHTSAVMLW